MSYASDAREPLYSTQTTAYSRDDDPFWDWQSGQQQRRSPGIDAPPPSAAAPPGARTARSGSAPVKFCIAVLVVLCMCSVGLLVTVVVSSNARNYFRQKLRFLPPLPPQSHTTPPHHHHPPPPSPQPKPSPPPPAPAAPPPPNFPIPSCWPRQANPLFNTSEELVADKGGWEDYLGGVYGRHTLQFPLDTGKLLFFYWDTTGATYPGAPTALRQYLGGRYPKNTEPHCTAISITCAHQPKQCDAWTFPIWEHWYKVKGVTTMWKYMYKATPPCYHATGACVAPPKGDSFFMASGAANHSWVEVMHAGHDVSASGYWMYLSTGSGIYYNIGRTAVFRDHREALAGLPGGHVDPKGDNLAGLQVARLAHAAGLDSVQYTHRLEGQYLYEIQDVRDLNTGAGASRVCPSAKLAPYLRAGWNASLECKCTEGDAQLLNCMPKPDNTTCKARLGELCPLGHNTTISQCLRCTNSASHTPQLKRAGCTEELTEGWCNQAAKGRPDAVCEAGLNASCAANRSSLITCFMCAGQAEADKHVQDCTDGIIETWCNRTNERHFQ